MSEFGFVLMPFKDDFGKVYEAIKRAIEAENLVCTRADAILSGSILRSIVDGIRNAKVIVADLTTKNANVFYELGIAHALRNNVIMLAQNIEQDVPFDVKPYKVIKYTNAFGHEESLKNDIQQAIRTLSLWSSRPSNPVQDFIPDTDRSSTFHAVRSENQLLKARNSVLERRNQELERLLNDSGNPLPKNEPRPAGEPRISMRRVSGGQLAAPKKQIRIQKISSNPPWIPKGDSSA